MGHHALQETPRLSPRARNISPLRSISEPGQLVLFSQHNPLQYVIHSFGSSCAQLQILWPLGHPPLSTLQPMTSQESNDRAMAKTYTKRSLKDALGFSNTVSGNNQFPVAGQE